MKGNPFLTKCEISPGIHANDMNRVRIQGQGGPTHLTRGPIMQQSSGSVHGGVFMPECGRVDPEGVKTLISAGTLDYSSDSWV